ncbi:MAG: GNAT family N-acetyltransferase [Polyangiaceae bacterium]|nr:GNAT family N-acetyltransferase [Polyangiaceae bacterium]
MQTRTFEDPSHLATLEQEWTALWSAARGSPAKHPSWQRAWWNAMGGARATEIGGARELSGIEVRLDDGALVGLALFVRRPVLWDPGPRVRLDLIGSGEAISDEVCSDYAGILASPGHEGAVAGAIAKTLLEWRSRWDDIVLPSVSEHDLASRALAEALIEGGCAVSMERTGVCPYVALPSSFDEYLSLLDSDRRYYVRRSLRDFESWAGEPPRLVRADRDEDLREGFRILEQLHGERWGDRGLFRSDRFRAFHHELSRQWHRGDGVHIDLSWLVARERPVAVLYSFVSDGILSFYQAGRAVDLPNKIRPGLVAHLAAIRRAIEEGLREYDFLEGEAQYKQKLMTAQRSLLTIRAVRGDVRATALDAAAVGARAVLRAVLRLSSGAAGPVSRPREDVVPSSAR